MDAATLAVLLSVLLGVWVVGNQLVTMQLTLEEDGEECTRDVLVDKIVYPDTVVVGEELAIILNITSEECIETSKIPIDVMLAIDRSGSMAGQKLTDAKNAAKKFIGIMNAERHRVGVVSFADNASLDQRLTFSLSSAINAVDGLKAEGYTNLGEAIRKAKEELIRNGRRRAIKVIIILSDGAVNRMLEPPKNCAGGHTVCPVSHTACTSYALGQADDAKANKIEIYTIGLGMDKLCNENQDPDEGREFVRGLLKNISTIDEYYYESPTSEDLEKIYDDIAERLTSIVAIELVIKDIIPPYFDYVPGSLTSGCEYDDVTNSITCDVGILSAGESYLIGFLMTSNEEGELLTNVYPASQITYKDYWGLPRTKIFPRLKVTSSPTPGTTSTTVPDIEYEDFDCNGTAQYVYTIHRGWNLVSSPCADIDIVEDGCGAKGSEFYYYNSSTGKWVIETEGMESMEPGIGYWVRSPSLCRINITGINDATPNDITIRSGWNYIGSPLGGMEEDFVLDLQHTCKNCEKDGSPGSCSDFELLAYDVVSKSWIEINSLEQGKGYVFNCVK